jgi:hypothetical protein
MDIGFGAGNLRVIDENMRQKALLAWATSRIDQMAAPAQARQLDDLVDWLAYFTREFFGFQRRLLSECGQQNEYLFGRIAAHSEFRRRLARLSLDTVRCDPSVPERLRSLCHDLLADAEANDQKLSEIFGSGIAALKLRRQPRRAQPATRATQLFERPTDDADTAAMAR